MRFLWFLLRFASLRSSPDELSLELLRKEIFQKSFKNRIDSKFFVYLPLIVRGENRAVEGNLCLYPEIQNLENFEVDIRCEFASLICVQTVFLLKHMG